MCESKADDAWEHNDVTPLGLGPRGMQPVSSRKLAGADHTHQAHGFMAKSHTGHLMYRAMRQLRLLKVMRYPKITGHSAYLASASTFDDILRSQHVA